MDCFASVATPWLLPVSLTRLECLWGWHSQQVPDLAPLSRLTRLEVLKFGDMINRIPPLPQLPALRTFVGITSDLQILSSVTATLETLELWAEKFDFRQPTTLCCFTRLRSFKCGFKEVRNLHPDVFPAGGSDSLLGTSSPQLCICDDRITWTRHAPM